MNFTKIILALTISYLLFMLFTSNANASESLEDVTIQIMDINDNVDDFINRIELPALTSEKVSSKTDDKDQQHVKPHQHDDSADELKPHDHPLDDDALSVDQSRDELQEQNHAHTPGDIHAEQREIRHEEAKESNAEALDQMKETRSHAEALREEASKEAIEIKNEAREHAVPGNN